MGKKPIDFMGLDTEFSKAALRAESAVMLFEKKYPWESMNRSSHWKKWDIAGEFFVIHRIVGEALLYIQERRLEERPSSLILGTTEDPTLRLYETLMEYRDGMAYLLSEVSKSPAHFLQEKEFSSWRDFEAKHNIHTDNFITGVIEEPAKLGSLTKRYPRRTYLLPPLPKSSHPIRSRSEVGPYINIKERFLHAPGVGNHSLTITQLTVFLALIELYDLDSKNGVLWKIVSAKADDIRKANANRIKLGKSYDKANDAFKGMDKNLLEHLIERTGDKTKGYKYRLRTRILNA